MMTRDMMRKDMRFTLSYEAYLKVLEHDSLTPEDVPYRYDEIWYAHTDEEKDFMMHLDGAMYHPGEICDCPPVGWPHGPGNQTA